MIAPLRYRGHFERVVIAPREVEGYCHTKAMVLMRGDRRRASKRKRSTHGIYRFAVEDGFRFIDHSLPTTNNARPDDRSVNHFEMTPFDVLNMNGKY